MQPQNIDINQLPKQYCENIVVGSNDQMFMLIAIVGTNATSFAISPEHAKNLLKILSEHVSKFEKDVRLIRDVSEGVRSPIQTSELDSNGKNGPRK